MQTENKIEQITQLIEDLQSQILHLKQLVSEIGPVDELRVAKEKAVEVGSIEADESTTFIEGVFDGQHMVGPDGKMYSVPANYASKSKLVEGDIMKLTITADGSFIYKQIGPVKRARITGTLVRDDETGTYRAVAASGRGYRLISASITYYKGELGDTVIILVPADMQSKWAAVENIVKQGEEVILEPHPDTELLLEDGSDAELTDGSTRFTHTF